MMKINFTVSLISQKSMAEGIKGTDTSKTGSPNSSTGVPMLSLEVKGFAVP